MSKTKSDFTLQNIVFQLLNKMKEHFLFLIFCFSLAILYILNNHVAFELVVEINNKAKILKETRWEYLSKKSELMYKSKLTEILSKAEQMNLKQLDNPPYKITLKTKDYQHQK